MLKDKKTKNTSSEKTRKFPRFGILDAVIILLVVAVAVGLAFRYNLFQSITQLQDLKEYTISFSIDNIEYTTQNYLNENDKVYFKDSGEELGKITKSSDVSNMILSVTPAKQTFVKDGKIIEVTYPEKTRIDAQGRIICKGNLSSEGSFLLNGNNYIAPGQSHIICTENVTLQINILSIDPIKAK